MRRRAKPFPFARNKREARPEWQYLWDSMIFCAPLTERGGIAPRDIVTGIRGTPRSGSAMTWEDGEHGGGLNPGGDSAKAAVWDSPASGLALPMSMYAVATDKQGTSGGFRGLIGVRTSTEGHWVQMDSGANVYRFRRDSAGASGTEVAQHRCRRVVAVTATTTDAKLYVDGKLDASDTTDKPFGSPDRVSIGALPAGSVDPFNGRIFLGAVFKIALPQAWIVRLWADPFGFLERRVARTYSVPEAAAGTAVPVFYRHLQEQGIA